MGEFRRREKGVRESDRARVLAVADPCPVLEAAVVGHSGEGRLIKLVDEQILAAVKIGYDRDRNAPEDRRQYIADVRRVRPARRAHRARRDNAGRAVAHRRASRVRDIDGEIGRHRLAGRDLIRRWREHQTVERRRDRAGRAADRVDAGSAVIAAAPKVREVPLAAEDSVTVTVSVCPKSGSAIATCANGLRLASSVVA